jgi:hypothetical protein
LNVTLLAPVKLVPTIDTLVPTVPPVGENELIAGGGGMTVNEVVLSPVPPGVVTEMVPLLAPLGTCAVMSVDELTTKLASVVPLNVTLVVPVKFAPWMSTLVPTVPVVGVNELIVGGGPVSVNGDALMPVPLGVVTDIGPVVAPGGTSALISESLLTP